MPIPFSVQEGCRRLAGDRRGTIAIAAALLALPIVAVAGAGVDYSRVTSFETAAQQALDAGALAAGAKGTIDLSKADKVFISNFDATRAQFSNLKYEQEGEYIRGSVDITVPMSFLGLIAVNDITVTLTTEAKVATPKLSTATFTIVSATGAFDKEVFIFTKNASGAITSQQTVLTYDYTKNRTRETRNYTPAIGSSYTVSLNDYETYGLGMIAYTDTSYTGRRINPIYFYSDSVSASTFIKRIGNCASTDGETSRWEDGGDANFNDLVTKMTCTYAKNSEALVRLTD